MRIKVLFQAMHQAHAVKMSLMNYKMLQKNYKIENRAGLKERKPSIQQKA